MIPREQAVITARVAPNALADTLARIEGRLARIERAVDQVNELSAGATRMVATATDILDERSGA